jgi:hypothetical protein
MPLLFHGLECDGKVPALCDKPLKSPSFMDSENAVRSVFTNAGYDYRTDSASCTVWYSSSLHEKHPGFHKRIYDGFIPKLSLYIEVKGGSYITDSIDKKFYAEAAAFVFHGMGDPVSNPTARVAFVLVGEKETSSWASLLRESIVEWRTAAYPDHIRQRAFRVTCWNLSDITPSLLRESHPRPESSMISVGPSA